MVTVGVPLYNHEKYIVKCLESIVKQSYKNIELIVIDDGSPDNSYEVAKNYLENQTYNNNYIIKTRQNRGLCNTLNEIAKQAKGKYISNTASDDYWMLNKIEEEVEFLEKHPDIALVHTNSIVIDDKDTEIGYVDYSSKKNSGYLYESIIHGKGGINSPSKLYRTCVYDKIGYYDPAFRLEDLDFWLRFTKVFKVGYINTNHTYYRRHGENVSDDKNILTFFNDEIVKIFKKNIDDEELKKTAILKIYRKSYLRALRTFQIEYFFKYMFKYLSFKYLNR